MAAATPSAHAGDGCVPHWSEQFGIGDLEGTFARTALEFDDDGPGPNNTALYFAGGFDNVGEVVVNSIAKWNGTSFSSVGNGFGGGGAWVLAVFDPDQGGPQQAALIAGGIFGQAGGSDASNIASWDGSAWSSLGTGLDDSVLALAVFDEDGEGPLPPALFAGGAFTAAGSETAAYIARWDGASWSAVGDGMDAEVISLLVWDPDEAGPVPALLVAGGAFEAAGGTAAARIAQWDGQAWSPLGAGMDDWVTALHSYDVDGEGPAVAELIAGGTFSSADSLPADSIAAWNGKAWTALGSGLTGAEHQLGGVASVYTMEVFDIDSDGHEELLVGGDFSSAGKLVADSIAAWDGAAWSPLLFPTDFGPSMTLLLVASEVGGSGEPLLYASAFDDITPNHIGKWDGTEFDALGGGIIQEVRAIAAVNESASDSTSKVLYVGGTPIPEVPGTENIARWDGSEWSALGAGFNNQVRALLAVDDDDDPRTVDVVYAGGNFTGSGQMPIHHIARWNGSTWSALGSGVGGSITALTRYDDTSRGSGASSIIAGGLFQSAGGVPAASVASWNGTSWSALGAGVNSFVYALAVFDEDADGPLSAALFAGGGFTVAGGQPASHFARWDGAAWTEVGGGMIGHVRALYVFDEDLAGPHPPALFVGGEFTSIGLVPAWGIARWSGTAWSTVGAGLNGPVYGLTSVDLDGAGAQPPRLVAGGWFHGSGVDHVGQWDGQEWLPIGGGTNLPVYALAAVNDSLADVTRQALFAGGAFEIAGGISSHRIARWGCDPDAAPSCPADQDEDGIVNGFDLAQLLASWGACLIPASCEADLDDNDVVNGTDLALLLGAWGPC